MDTGLSDDLLDQKMFGIFIWLLSFLSFSGFWNFLWLEDIKGEAFVFAECSVDNELVLFIGLGEVYDLFTISINVGSVIIVILDLLLWRDKFADIGSGGSCELFEVVSQVLKVITEVGSTRDGVVKDCLLVLDNIIGFLAFSLSCIELFSERSILFNICLDNSHLFILLLNDPLLLLVILEPLGQEVNRVGRLGFVHDSHTFGDDLSQVSALKVLSVRNCVNHLSSENV